MGDGLTNEAREAPGLLPSPHSSVHALLLAETGRSVAVHTIVLPDSHETLSEILRCGVHLQRSPNRRSPRRTVVVGIMEAAIGYGNTP